MRILMLALCLTISACGGGSDAAKEDAREETKEAVFDPYVSSMDKANAVEQQVLDQKDQLDKAIRESEGGASEDDDEE